MFKDWQGHEGDVISATYNSNDTIIISGGSNDKLIKIWDVNSGYTNTKTITGHSDEISYVAFSADD